MEDVDWVLVFVDFVPLIFLSAKIYDFLDKWTEIEDRIVKIVWKGYIM